MIVLRTSFRVRLTLNCFCIVVHDKAAVNPHDVSMADSQMPVGCSGKAARDTEDSNWSVHWSPGSYVNEIIISQACVRYEMIDSPRGANWL